jgi:hypothetical protein
VEVRAVPHVTIEAQYIDSKGKPTRGHESHIFGQIDGVPWFGDAKVSPAGKMFARVPHGLTNTQLNLMTNEHGVLRWRKSKDEPLSSNRLVMLGTMTDDLSGMEIIRYTAPIVLVMVATKDGAKPSDVGVTADYSNRLGQRGGKLLLAGGRESDVSFEKQEDGKFRSSQLLPDEEVIFTAHAQGYRPTAVTLKVTEGETKEIELVLEKGPVKPEAEKK